MADTRLQRWLSSLETQFDAAIAREEEAAASDLALSFRQGQTLREVLRRGSWTVEVDGVGRRVGVVGADFVLCDGPHPILVPMRRAVLAASNTEDPARVSAASLVIALRVFCRAGSTVEIHCGGKRFEGRLLHVGGDHLAVNGRSGQALVPLEALDCVGLTGGSRALAI